MWSARVTTTRLGTASRTFTLTSAQKRLASLPLAIRFGTKCASFAASIATPTPTATPIPTPTPTPTPAPKPTLTSIDLNTPASGATIDQNNPAAPGCLPLAGEDANRGFGFTVGFDWNAPPLNGVEEYELVLQHVGSLYPALDVRVATPDFTWTDCNTFVTDQNLSSWHWQVKALNNDKQVIAVSEQRAISFLPCRLADGTTACSAP